MRIIILFFFDLADTLVHLREDAMVHLQQCQPFACGPCLGGQTLSVLKDMHINGRFSEQSLGSLAYLQLNSSCPCAVDGCRLLSGRALLPEVQDMQADVTRFYQQLQELGTPLRHAHMLDQQQVGGHDQ
jgi:hypothetical protein